MSDIKDDLIPVELVIAAYYWICPNCGFENERTIKRSAHAVNELYCDNCDLIIEKKGEIYWSAR